MRFRTRVAIQAPVEVRDGSGGVSRSYETIDALADVAATIMPAVEESRDPDLVTVEDRYDIVLAGHHPEVRPESVRITNVVGRRGRVMATKFQATLEGGPELAQALAKLDDAVRVRASKDALLAAGGVLANEWQGRVPILDANYQHSLEGAQRAAKAKPGASGSVAPRKVPGLPDGDQPFAYAARLEFGDADRPAEPSARPAFDTASERAVQAAGDVLSKAAEGVAR